MTETAESLEQALARDLHALEDRFVDEEFSTQLYRTLAGCALERDGADGRVALSWRRAEELVNEQRVRIGYEALVLAQTGREGELTDLVAGELGRLGWRARPRSTDEHDPDHLSSPESPPPPDHGERMAPVEDSSAWERRAHEDAERERRRR
jgi:hypothetical protein